MNYSKHYELLIDRAKTREISGYSEKHHIVPRCIGGTDCIENLVKLPPEEHFLAHLLLVKIYPNCFSLVYAANMMTVTASNQARNNKMYGWLKRRYSHACEDRVGSKNPSYGKRWFHCPVSGENGKFLETDVPVGWVKGRVPVVPNSKCEVCQCDTGSPDSRWCSEHRVRRKKTVFKAEKSKPAFTDDEKLEALKRHNGNIRRALFSLGLNDSGANYKKMKILKASLYPLATN